MYKIVSQSMNKDKVEYIFMYFSNLMTSLESKAWRHHTCSVQLEDRNNPDDEAKTERENIYFKKGWMSKDPEVLTLLENGVEAFKINVAKRICKEHKETVKYNYCKNCSELARTPKARQCRFCGYTWFDESL